MKIAMGADHAGYRRKEALKEYLQDLGHEITDVGTDSTDRVDYPAFGKKAAELVAEGSCEKGIVICGSGIGIGIAANKVRGVRCAMVSEPYSAKLARRHNDANMIAMGARTIGGDMTREIARAFLEEEFEGGRHSARVEQLEDGAWEK
ncbi:Ribose-5-phosphate isomerase B [Aedoeadaptatus ivorii]|uniref:Ribose-5-phosphate isomerase B n=1 Tax=Aedoeadaptatus ivorii TaxID=54006 RepID=A0A448V027_9FIRM|nr:ribose 5-phosphate isomerase B [Peptoniphilus ivorii]MDQ0507959.1 ribose 5-phosphate isomerase B [Peptoniphilus ivorii]VEJ34779.1 Ribose-5-phosphate isomerase B [Peptoniphilus ivorii]